MSKILTLDASTEACSVALINETEVTERYQLAPRQHAKLLLPMVEELLAGSQLKLNQLDAIACSVGPGAFTGIRIAVSVAQGLAYGANLPTIALSSLANLAALGFAKTAQKEWLCAIDARMNEVYFAGYKINDGIPQLIENEQVVKPNGIEINDIELTLSTVGLIGSGWPAYADSMYSNGLSEAQLLADCYPSAKYGLSQAQALLNNNVILAPEELQPTYLRNNVAVKKTVNN